MEKPPQHETANRNHPKPAKWQRSGKESSAFTGHEGETQLEVALRPAAPIIMTALLPNGQPAALEDVGPPEKG
jgi:hypothetical protein